MVTYPIYTWPTRDHFCPAELIRRGPLPSKDTSLGKNLSASTDGYYVLELWVRSFDVVDNTGIVIRDATARSPRNKQDVELRILIDGVRWLHIGQGTGTVGDMGWNRVQGFSNDGQGHIWCIERHDIEQFEGSVGIKADISGECKYAPFERNGLGCRLCLPCRDSEGAGKNNSESTEELHLDSVTLTERRSIFEFYLSLVGGLLEISRIDLTLVHSFSRASLASRLPRRSSWPWEEEFLRIPESIRAGFPMKRATPIMYA